MSSVFATLTPSNGLARLAFSDVYDELTTRRQSNQADGTQAALLRMLVEPEQRRDDKVVRFLREMERAKFDTDGEANDALTEPDTDDEKSFTGLGTVWVGHYLLGLQSPPAVLERGWSAGKGPLENLPIDLILCTKNFAKVHGIDIRKPHALFNFLPETGSLYIKGCSRSPSAELRANGDSVAQQPYHLNQHSMKIEIAGKLDYIFQWTELAAQNEFIRIRRRYISSLRAPQHADVDFEMPTPFRNGVRMGKWTLGPVLSLGPGGYGNALLASDSSGNVVAIKRLQRTTRNFQSVDEEIKAIREVTRLAESSDDGERIMRMAEIIYSNGKDAPAFGDVHIVLKPMTPNNFSSLIARSKGGPPGMTMEAATAFREALLGLKVMHDEGWLHRDLSPINIGLFRSPIRSVLLGIGTSKHIGAAGALTPEPGSVGTIGYLAPELELINYDRSIDIWAMGIILFELTYNYHPWQFSINPWRDGKDNEELRPSFQESYQNAVDKMAKDYNIAHPSPLEGYIHLGGLFIEMVRYRWAANNCAQRPDINQVLQHPAWGPLLSEPSQAETTIGA